MVDQDVWLRAFYKAERQAYLRERWAMADEEREMRALLKREEAATVKSKYDVGGGAKPAKASKKASPRATSPRCAPPPSPYAMWKEAVPPTLPP